MIMGLVTGLLGSVGGFSKSHGSTITLLILMAPVFLGGVWFGGYTTARKANKVIHQQTHDCAKSVLFTAEQTEDYNRHVVGKSGCVRRGTMCGWLCAP